MASSTKTSLSEQDETPTVETTTTQTTSGKSADKTEPTVVVPKTTAAPIQNTTEGDGTSELDAVQKQFVANYGIRVQ